MYSILLVNHDEISYDIEFLRKAKISKASETKRQRH